MVALPGRELSGRPTPPGETLRARRSKVSHHVAIFYFGSLPPKGTRQVFVRGASKDGWKGWNMSDIPETVDLNWIARHLPLIGLTAALAFLSGTALAEQGTSSSWGSVGAGPHISTQALTPFDRQWNFDNQAKYQAQDSADWLRQHGKGLFSFFGAANPR
jgi:hypothetical protein